MATLYSIRVLRNGSLLDLVDNFISLSYTKRVNSSGQLTSIFDANNAIFSTLQLNDDIQIVRENLNLRIGIYNQIDFYGIFRGASQRFAGENELLTIYCPDLHYLLRKIIVAYKAGQETLSKWTNKQVSAIISDLINNNFTFSGSPTPPGQASRLIPVTSQVMSRTGGSLGSTISYAAAYKLLSEALQELIKIDGLDYVLSKTLSQANLHLTTLYGTDRSNSVFFWLERGNMLTPSLDKRRDDEPTKVLVAGQGEGLARATEVRTSAAYDAATNHMEAFADARHLDNTLALQALGDSRLVEKAYRPNLTFEAVQIPSCFYGKHYFLGDKISAIYAGETVVQKIVGVTVGVDADSERIQLELENV